MNALGVAVLLVHGIWDDGACFGAMRSALTRAGIGPVDAIDLEPNDGSARIETLADQVDEAADALLTRTGEQRLDLVGFSMGALVSRYWLQRLDGRERARRFVSISGPHRGTATALVVPLAGARQMRPRSALLKDLASDDEPWGEVEVHTIWSPMDLMILPATSSKLPRAHGEHKLPIVLHRWMMTHPRVLETVVSILR